MRQNIYHSTKMVPEVVLVLQGGGSLGAYECGVYKGLSKNGIDFDILAGSSIGAINTSIIASAQNIGNDVASSILEDFWLSLSENMGSLNPFSQSPFPFMSSDEMMAVWFSICSVFYGNPKVFLPRWFIPDSRDYFMPYKWTYLYDTAPLKKTLKQYLDIDRLKKLDHNRNNSNNTKDNRKHSRVIISSTDLQKGESVIFDALLHDSLGF